jgi:flagellin-like protein
MVQSRIGRKGISPLVAAVLLIAVTMTIAGLLAYWAASFVRTSLPETNETEAECRFADFNIYSCTYFNGTNTLSVILKNEKNIELRTLKAFLIFPNMSVSNPIEMAGTLPPGGTLKSFTLSNVNEDFSRMSISSHCPEVVKEKVCSKS